MMIDNRSLLDPSAVGQTLRGLASRVEKAGDSDAGQRLRLLGEAVEKRLPSSSTWATIDIQKIIDADSIAEYYRQRKATLPGVGLELIELLRNVLIFLPIFVTWLGISLATASYNDYVSAALAKHDTIRLAQPFLYLWQQGFDKRLPGVWSLSSVALIDVFILSIIIVLTLISHVVSNANRLREEMNARDLHSKLVHAVARATLCLNDGQQHQLIGGSGKGLDQVATDVRDMATEIMNTFGKLETDLMTRFDGVVNNLTTQFNQVTKDLSAQVQMGGKYLGTLGNTASALQKLAQDMNTSAKNLIDANQEMTKSVIALINPAKDLAVQHQKLLQSVDKSILLLEKNATSLGDITKQQTSLINDLVVSLGTVRTTTQQMNDAIIQLGDFINQQEELLKEMKSERTEQGKLAKNMAQVMLGARETQKALSDLAINFRQIAVDSNDIMRMYASMPKNLGSEIAVAVQLIEKGGGELSTAAMSIFSASQFFEKVVADQEQLVSRLAASGIIP